MLSNKYKNRISICNPGILSYFFRMMDREPNFIPKYKIQSMGRSPINIMLYTHATISIILYPVVSVVCHINNLFRAIDRRGFQRCDSDIVRVACGFSSLEKYGSMSLPDFGSIMDMLSTFADSSRS